MIYLSQRKEQAICTVQDQGIGIRPEELENIFQPFYRSEDIMFKTSGIGLGLDLVQRALKLHNGKIEIRSLSKGSIFRAILPYRI